MPTPSTAIDPRSLGSFGSGSIVARSMTRDHGGRRAGSPGGRATRDIGARLSTEYGGPRPATGICPLTRWVAAAHPAASPAASSAAGVAPGDHALQHVCEQAIRNYDPCISCATHFLDLTVDRT